MITNNRTETRIRKLKLEKPANYRSVYTQNQNIYSYKTEWQTIA